MPKLELVRQELNKMISVSTQNVKVPALTIQLIVDLDEPVYKVLDKDSRWHAIQQEKAYAKVKVAAEEIKKHILDADAKVAKFPKQSEIFEKDLNSFVQAKLTKTGEEVAKDVQTYLDDFKKGNKEVTKFKAKCTAKIGFTAIIVATTTAATAASHGALAPLGIVAIVKGGIVITQEIVKLAINADGAAKIVHGELVVLKGLMSEKIAGAKTKGATEVALNVISKALSIETPSIKNCEKHIEVHHIKILEMEKDSHKLAPILQQAMGEEKKYREKLKAKKGQVDDKKIAKIEAKLDNAEKALAAIVNTTFTIADAIKKGEDREEEWKKAIDALKSGIPDWVKYVDVAIGAAMDIAVAVHDASGVAEQALNAIIAAEQAIGTEVIEKV